MEDDKAGSTAAPNKSSSHEETASELMCSFCGKNKTVVKLMITGPHGVCICNECVAVCEDIVADGSALKKISNRLHRYSTTMRIFFNRHDCNWLLLMTILILQIILLIRS